MKQADFKKIEQMINSSVEEKTSHYFGLLKDLLLPQFLVINERFVALEEKMDRGFAELKSEITQIKFIVDSHSIQLINHDKRIKKLERARTQ